MIREDLVTTDMTEYAKTHLYPNMFTDTFIHPSAIQHMTDICEIKNKHKRRLTKSDNHNAYTWWARLIRNNKLITPAIREHANMLNYPDMFDREVKNEKLVAA
jgi:hypothetical protein